MRRRFIDAPLAVRCIQTITLRDGSQAQCGRRRTKGKHCAQHEKLNHQRSNETMRTETPQQEVDRLSNELATNHAKLAESPATPEPVDEATVTVTCFRCGGAVAVPRKHYENKSADAGWYLVEETWLCENCVGTTEPVAGGEATAARSVTVFSPIKAFQTAKDKCDSCKRGDSKIQVTPIRFGDFGTGKVIAICDSCRGELLNGLDAHNQQTISELRSQVEYLEAEVKEWRSESTCGQALKQAMTELGSERERRTIAQEACVRNQQTIKVLGEALRQIRQELSKRGGINGAVSVRYMSSLADAALAQLGEGESR